MVIGTTISGNAGDGVAVTGSRSNQIGTPQAGDTISSNGEDGVFLTGNVTGTKVQANTIGSNVGDGVMLVNARNATIGGAPGRGNRIIANGGYGIDSRGKNTGTVVGVNEIAGNGEGDTH